MNRSVDRFPHRALLEMLVEIDDERLPEWRQLSAALLCLRAVDRYAVPVWLPPEERDAPPPLAPVRDVVDSIEALDPAREVLRNVLHALAAPVQLRPTKVFRALVPYGRLLESRAMWNVAADVYQTALPYGHRSAVRHDRPAILLRLGECHRQCAEWDDADAAFAGAARSAMSRRDLALALQADCYRATVAAQRGNLAAADARLRRVERAAMEANLNDVRALAAHGRAHVAFQRGDYESAARFAYQALQGLSEPAARDRALVDLAAALAELGIRAAARDAHLIIAATAQEPSTRWTSLINLMEIAALDGMRAPFEQYRRELAAASLPPRLAGYYHYYAGMGARAFGDWAAATAELDRAIVIGRAAGLAELVSDADAARRQLGAPPPPSGAPPSRTPSETTVEIADALVRMRHAAVGADPASPTGATRQ